MNPQDTLDYQRIAKAIEYIADHFKEQPSLDEIAEKVHLSPHHFQRLFTEWAGISPKKFLQFLSVKYAKQVLAQSKATLLETAQETGLSGTGRLHDLFVTIEGMTPGEFKNGGEGLTINYYYTTCNFGKLIAASTAKGICYLAFCDNEDDGLIALQHNFPKATFFNKLDDFHQDAFCMFTSNWSVNKLPQIKLHLKGSPFQLKVWEALLKIPMGSLTTYGTIAQQINQPNASRAVGTAIGSNPVAYLIPCHRVIQSSGSFGGYMWGPIRKAAIIGWEASQTRG